MMMERVGGSRLRRWASTGVGAVMALAILAGTAAAQSGQGGQGNNNNGQGNGGQDNGSGNGNKHVSAPEINAGATVGALALLVGGVLILTDRTRKVGAGECPGA
jgi:hypothetical protein